MSWFSRQPDPMAVVALDSQRETIALLSKQVQERSERAAQAEAELADVHKAASAKIAELKAELEARAADLTTLRKLVEELNARPRMSTVAEDMIPADGGLLGAIDKALKTRDDEPPAPAFANSGVSGGHHNPPEIEDPHRPVQH